MNWLVFLAILALLIFINALYVAAEFATASSRRSRLANAADEGNRVAGMVLAVVENPITLDNYIATCQLGITASSLILGFYGQAALRDLLAPLLPDVFSSGNLLAESIATTVILLFLTTLQVLFGELVPKNIGVRYPEKLAQTTYWPIRWSMIILRPLIVIFNGSAGAILRLFGRNSAAEHMHVHAPEEIMLLVEESGVGGVIDLEERLMLENALQLRERPVRQVMVPRTRMLTASVERSCGELFKLLSQSTYSRLPLYEDSPDRIVGIVHLKDLLKVSWPDESCDDIRSVMNDPYFVPEALPVAQAFGLMQRDHQHLAIVVDEYGGTAGLLTFEDVIEEVFGDIQDEFDRESPQFRTHDRGVVVDGGTAVEEVNEYLGLKLPEDSATTIGGLVYDEAGHIPVKGEIVVIGKIELQIEGMDGNRIVSVLVLRDTPESGREGQ